jgi:pimeloyl-ACP methyl ester carboxylesterase
MTTAKINLLLLPGMLNDERLWKAQITALGEYANISVADMTKGESIAEIAANVLAAAPEGRFALAGLSLGGYVALEIMRTAPDRVLGLALLDTSARPDTEESTAKRNAQIAQAADDWPGVVKALQSKLVHTAHLENTALIDVMTAMANDLGKDVFARQQRAIISRIDSRPFLHQIACPTLILCGREDQVTPLETHEELAVAIPAATVEIVDHCGHVSALEQPLPVIVAMEAWLHKLMQVPTAAVWPTDVFSKAQV